MRAQGVGDDVGVLDPQRLLLLVAAEAVARPISGTAARMKDRAWTIYVSGPRKVCQQVAPVFKAFTDMAPYIGPLGAGTKLKFAANHLVAIYNVAYAETVNLCRKMGLDPQVTMTHFAHSPVLGTGVMRAAIQARTCSATSASSVAGSTMATESSSRSARAMAPISLAKATGS